MDFLWSDTGLIRADYNCFSNSYAWLKFLKRIGIKIDLCSFPRVSYSSMVEQNRLTIPYLFNVNLWLCSNRLLNSKLNQNDPHGSNLTKNCEICIEKIFFLSFQPCNLSLGCIWEKITKKFFESFYIHHQGKFLKNSIGSNDHIIN